MKSSLLPSCRGERIIDTHWSYLVYFFFSSRRRHTRFKCDWSSDVCSSDLVMIVVIHIHAVAFPFPIAAAIQIVIRHYPVRIVVEHDAAGAVIDPPGNNYYFYVIVTGLRIRTPRAGSGGGVLPNPVGLAVPLF